MRLALIGDICGHAGRNVLADNLRRIRTEHGLDFIVANAENAAGGMGVTPDVSEELLDLGIHVLTSGNHIWAKRDIYEYLDETDRLLRPANYPQGAPGHGWGVFRESGLPEVAVINLQGRVFMPPVDCPFRTADSIMGELEGGPSIRIVDFHAEATSEKLCMGWYLNGRVTAVLGTHTHVQTADAHVLPGGETGYITDVGMTGAMNSVLGMKKEQALRRFLTGLPGRFEPAKKNPAIMGAVVDVDEATGRCTGIYRLHVSGTEF